MKQLLAFIACLLILQPGHTAARNDRDEIPGSNTNEVTVSASPETEVLVTAWIEAFRQRYPERTVNMASTENSRSADLLIITSGNKEMTEDPSVWKMVLGRDIIVAVMSISDPLSGNLSSRGISAEEYSKILRSGGDLTWGKLLGNEDSAPVQVIIPDDEAAVEAITRFAQVPPGQATVRRTKMVRGTTGYPEVKPGTITFCRLADITDSSGLEFSEGIQIIPVDVNGNATSDYFEQFYSDFDSFTRGVYIGKYPKSLCNNIYAVMITAPAGGAPAELLRFILVDGQRFLAESGFSALAYGEGINRSESLATDQIIVTEADGNVSTLRAWLWVMIVVLSVMLVAYAIYLITKSGVREVEAGITTAPSAFSPASLVTPGGILYDKSHSWSFMEMDGSVRVGIDDFLQHITGPITKIGMRAQGEKIRKGENMLSVIQNGKKLEIKSPVSGTVITRNERVMADADIIHTSPYENGWIYRIDPDNWEKESRLMITATRYTDFLKAEFGKIRDFLAVMPGVNDPVLAHVVLQDGGEFRDGFLEEFGPEVWEEFQVKFLD